MSSSWAARAGPILGTQIDTPDDAAAVVRRVGGRVQEPTAAAVFLDGSRRVIAVVPVRRRRTAALLRACGLTDARAAVGAFLGFGGELGSGALGDAWHRARTTLAEEGPNLVDWLDVREDAWASVASGETGWEAA